ncbi:MAG: TrmH family RNA methyltransferase [Lutibacter sp.]
MSLSKSQFKLITSLHQKKYRNKHRLFVVEGLKTVKEFINSPFKLATLFSVEENLFEENINTVLITEAELKKISNLKSPNKVLALFEIPKEHNIENQGLILALDDVNDPGNLGTIIRLCDWFGITQIVCSKNTVDCYNSKVIQSSMGSLTRVQLYYENLIEFINSSSLPVFATEMGGNSIYETNCPKNAIIVMGNEANGIRNKILEKAHHLIGIPRYGNLQQTESLNVAMATAIVLNEFRRNS